jgi:uncharacterized repeat protein (TIGR04076 family)
MEDRCMAKDPELGYKMVATVVDVKGKCSVGHKVGDSFEISCHNPAGLCGFFYHNIFPSLQTFQFGANMPWGKEIPYFSIVQIAITL